MFVSNNSSLPIGIIDSGIGGLTILKTLQKTFPSESFLYIGDTLHMPYGNKTFDFIIERTIFCIEFLIKKKVKLIIIACHTASSVALEKMQSRFSIPIIGVLKPAIETAIKKSKSKQIALMATQATIDSKHYLTFLKTKPDVDIQGIRCPRLATLIENTMTCKQELSLTLQGYLAPILPATDVLILGCTHYPLIKKSIQAFIPSTIELVDASDSICIFLKAWLQSNSLSYLDHRVGKSEVFLTMKSPHFMEFAKKVRCSIDAIQIVL